jgi:hypothetical protein
MKMTTTGKKARIVKRKVENLHELKPGCRYFFSYEICQEQTHKTVFADARLKSLFYVEPNKEMGTVWESGSFGIYSLTICDSPKNIKNVYTWEFLDVPECISDFIGTY